MISLNLLIEVLSWALLASFMASALIVMTKQWHGLHSMDADLKSIQKMHKSPVPRIGGIALLSGLAAVPIAGEFGVFQNSASAFNVDLLLLLLAAAPVFIAGLVEDITKSVSVKTRLLASFASALLAVWLVAARLPRFDIWGLDIALELFPVSVLFTMIAVGGVTNSINIIDGFNGVAGGAVVVMLSGLAFLAGQAGDSLVMHLAFAGIGATLGFLLLNYPTGRLFMGDGGAYLIGFWLAEVAVLAVARNASISPWHVFAICAYPVIEVVFSMYRRKFVRKTGVGTPDRLHLHTLVYRRLVCQIFPGNANRPWLRNAAVAGFVVAWTGIVTVLTIWLGNSIAMAVGLVGIQAVLYMIIYTRLVRRHWCWSLNPAIVLGLRAERRIKTSRATGFTST